MQCEPPQEEGPAAVGAAVKVKFQPNWKCAWQLTSTGTSGLADAIVRSWLDLKSGDGFFLEQLLGIKHTVGKVTEDEASQLSEPSCNVNCQGGVCI